MKDKIKVVGALASLALMLGLGSVFFQAQVDKAQAQNSILSPSRIIDGTVNNTNGGTWTNRILGSGQASPVNTRIDTSTFKDCAIELSFEAASANSGLVTMFLGRNNNGLNGNTNMEQFAILSATANATTHITVCTNLGSPNLGGAYRYYYIMAISNGGVGFLTNYTVTVNLK